MKVKTIAGTGILCALACALTFLSNYVINGSININLSLIPIAVAAIMFGPISGGIVGFANGVVTMFAPTTLGLFFPTSIIGTILACLLKGTVAGIASGYIYKAILKKNKNLAIVLASLIVPILNTSIFVLIALAFYGKIWKTIFTIFLVINFLIEIGVSTALCPFVIRLIGLAEKQKVN